MLLPVQQSLSALSLQTNHKLSTFFFLLIIKLHSELLMTCQIIQASVPPLSFINILTTCCSPTLVFGSHCHGFQNTKASKKTKKLTYLQKRSPVVTRPSLFKSTISWALEWTKATSPKAWKSNWQAIPHINPGPVALQKPPSLQLVKFHK